MVPWHQRIGFRLALGFGAVMLLFTIATTVADSGVRSLGDALVEVLEQERGVQSGLRLMAATREKYAHQAHLIISNDPVHLEHIEEASRHIDRWLDCVTMCARTDEERALAEDLRRENERFDAIHRDRVRPAFLANDHAAVLAAHAESEQSLARLVELNERLSQSFGARILASQIEAASRLARAKIAGLSSFVLAALVSLGVSLALSRSVGRPVAALARAMGEVASGRLGTRVAPEPGGGELGILARGFNRMTSDLETRQRALVQAETLASVGRLAAGFAHEIGNPLAVIQGFVRCMEKDAPAGSRAADDLKTIGAEVEQCKRIVRDLLDLARPPRDAAEPVDLRALVDAELARVARREGAPVVTIATELREPLPEVRLETARIRQVLSHIVWNAVEAMPEGGRLTVGIEPCGVLAEAAAGNGGPRGANGAAAARPGVHMSVSDTGQGIAPEHAARAFEPFFTTKPSGTGLGLAVSYAIVRSLGGSIELDGAPGRGTTVHVRLPCSVPPSAGAVAPGEASP